MAAGASGAAVPLAPALTFNSSRVDLLNLHHSLGGKWKAQRGFTHLVVTRSAPSGDARFPPIADIELTSTFDPLQTLVAV